MIFDKKRIMKKLLIYFVFLLLSNSLFAQNINKDYNYESSLLPGVGYEIYKPRSLDSLGMWHGPQFNFIFHHDNSSGSSYHNDGPGIYSIYMKLSALKSERENNLWVKYAAGFDVSFEGIVMRNFFIPKFGMELGGSHQSFLGNSAYLRPNFTLGVTHFKQLEFNLRAGYDFNFKHFETMSGYSADASINFYLW